MNPETRINNWHGILFIFFIIISAQSHALPLLSSPSADDLSGPAFVEPFAGFSIISETNGIGRTSAFLSDLPDGALPGNNVFNILF